MTSKAEGKTGMTEFGRLALRREGEWWKAYWTPDQHSMTRAVLIGSIRLATVKGRVREDFMELMKAAFDNVAEEACGQKFRWGKPTPTLKGEHSRVQRQAADG